MTEEIPNESTKKEPKSPPLTQNEPKNKDFELEDLLYIIPNKITFDPNKTSPLLHFSVFIGILSFMFFLSFMLDDLGTVPSKKNKMTSIKNRIETFMKYAQSQDKFKLNMSDVNLCELYIASSSIPGRNLGVFSGKFIKKGDVVLNEGISIMLDNNRELQLPNLLVNSHPNITNLIPTTAINCRDDEPFCVTPSYEASRDIEPGDELFLYSTKQRSQMVKEMNRNYNLLDSIIKDILQSNRPRRAGNQVSNNFGLNDSVLRTIKRIIHKFDPALSELLPFDSNKLKQYALFGSAYQTLQNRTLAFLLRNGACMIQNANTNIKKNQNITRIPLFTLKNDTLKPFKQWNCFSYSSYYLCPTLPTKFSKDESNAKYEFVFTSRKTKDFVLKDTNGEVIDGLELNIVSTRDISKNEEIVIGYERLEVSCLGDSCHDSRMVDSEL